MDDRLAQRLTVLKKLFNGHPFVDRVQNDGEMAKVVEEMTPPEFLNLVNYLRSSCAPARKRAVKVDSFGDVIRIMRSAKKILVLTGAGISTSCGIPDFRSADGVYSMLDGYKLADPQDLFSIKYFRRNTKPFYDFARKLWPGTHRPAPTHYFIRLLQDSGQLHRNYTQNIDTLEEVAGITNVLQCHGSFSTATCTRCKFKCPGTKIKDDIMVGSAPMCPICVDNPQPSLMMEFALRDPNIQSYRFAAGAFKLPVPSGSSSDSDSDQETESPRNRSHGESETNPRPPSTTSSSSSSSSVTSKSAVAQQNQTLPSKHQNQLHSRGTTPTPAHPKNRKTSLSLNINQSSASNEPTPVLEPDSPFTSARQVFGHNHADPPFQRPPGRSNSLASELDANIFPSSPSFEKSIEAPVEGSSANGNTNSAVSTPVGGSFKSKNSFDLSIPSEIAKPEPAPSAFTSVALSEEDVKVVQNLGAPPTPRQCQTSSSSSSSSVTPLLTNSHEQSLARREKDTPKTPIPSFTAENPSKGEPNRKAAESSPPRLKNRIESTGSTHDSDLHYDSSCGRSRQDSTGEQRSDQDDEGTKDSDSASQERSPRNGSRSSSALNLRSMFMSPDELPFVDIIYDRGVMKPDIVFFGESLPPEFFNSIEKDVELCDLVLVLGTSLKVAPVSKIVEMVRPDVPQILINRELVAQPHQFDVELLGNCDNVAAAIANSLGWNLTQMGESAVSPASLDLSMKQSEKYSHRFVFHGAQETDDEVDDDEDEVEYDDEDDDDDDDKCKNDGNAPENKIETPESPLEVNRSGSDSVVGGKRAQSEQNNDQNDRNEADSDSKRLKLDQTGNSGS